MSIADKLTAIAENQQKVYDAGQKDMHSLWLNQAVMELDEPEVTAIGAYQFYEFTKLERAIFPAVTTSGVQAFSGCSVLWDTSFPLLEAVTERMFRVTNVHRLDAPKASSIGALAFSYTNRFTALILRSDTLCTLANTNAFTSTRVADGTGYIYVPAALVEEYKAATNWSNYADQIRAIEDYPNLDNDDALVITKQPTDVTAEANTASAFTVEAEGDDLQYAWFVNTGAGNGFVQSTFTGYNSATQEIGNYTSRDGWQWYCEVTDCYGHMVKTNIVTQRVAT